MASFSSTPLRKSLQMVYFSSTSLRKYGACEKPTSKRLSTKKTKMMEKKTMQSSVQLPVVHSYAVQYEFWKYQHCNNGTNN